MLAARSVLFVNREWCHWQINENRAWMEIKDWVNGLVACPSLLAAFERLELRRAAAQLRRQVYHEAVRLVV